MKSETIRRKYNIKDISNEYKDMSNHWCGFIGTDNSYLKIAYNDEVVYYVNTKPFGIDIYGNKIGRSDE